MSFSSTIDRSRRKKVYNSLQINTSVATKHVTLGLRIRDGGKCPSPAQRKHDKANATFVISLLLYIIIIIIIYIIYYYILFIYIIFLLFVDEIK